MRPAPIQLLQVFFKKVMVELDELHAPKEPPNPLTAVFVFDGVSINTEFSIGQVDADHDRGRMFYISLRVTVDNAVQDDVAERKFSPYLIDIEADGLILLPHGAESLALPEDLVSVNGASLLWSSVREQVLAITSRMSAGPVTLPTVNFHDLKVQGSDALTATTPVKEVSVSKKRRSVKKR